MELDMLKEEILDWIKTQPKGKKFTSADVYASVDSAEDPAKVSDVLRGLARSNILNRGEFKDGNRIRFTYWLKEEPKAMPEPENKAVVFDDSNKGKQPATAIKEEVKQIEIPNNFTLELRTPNGFVITIKSSDINAK